MSFLTTAEAHDLVTSFGDSLDATIIRRATAADPLDPNNQIETATTYAATVAPNSAKLSELDGAVLRVSDRVLSVSPEGLAIVPRPGDEVVEGVSKATYDAANPKPVGLRVEFVLGSEWPYDVVLR